MSALISVRMPSAARVDAPGIMTNKPDHRVGVAGESRSSGSVTLVRPPAVDATVTVFRTEFGPPGRGAEPGALGASR